MAENNAENPSGLPADHAGGDAPTPEGKPTRIPLPESDYIKNMPAEQFEKLSAVNYALSETAGKGAKTFDSRPFEFAYQVDRYLHGKTSVLGELVKRAGLDATDLQAAQALRVVMHEQGFSDLALQHYVNPLLLEIEAAAFKPPSGGFSLGPRPTKITSAIEAEPHHARGGLGKIGGVLGAGAALYVLGTTVADASEGHKLEALGEAALRLVPGVTGAEKLSNTNDPHRGMNAALDFGGLIVPFAEEIARKPNVQAVIDAMPEDPRQLAAQLHSQSTPYIDRHLAEAQLQYIDARVNRDDMAALSASSRLTNLAEQRLELQGQWQKNASTFEAAVNNPNTDWPALARGNPDLAVPIARHIAAVDSGIDPQALSQKDAAIIQDVASGIPPETSSKPTMQQTQSDQGIQL